MKSNTKPYGVCVCLCIVRNCQSNYMKMLACFHLLFSRLNFVPISFSISGCRILAHQRVKIQFYINTLLSGLSNNCAKSIDQLLYNSNTHSQLWSYISEWFRFISRFSSCFFCWYFLRFVLYSVQCTHWKVIQLNRIITDKYSMANKSLLIFNVAFFFLFSPLIGLVHKITWSKTLQ